MKLSLKERKLVLEYAKKLLKNRITEAFKSQVMRDLNNFKVPLDPKFGMHREESITQYLKGLSINASELTDNDIKYYPPSSEPKKIMGMYPKSTLIFVDTKKYDVVGIIHKGKPVGMSVTTSKYVKSYNIEPSDPRNVRNSADKRRSVYAAQTGSSKSDKTGLSSIYSISQHELYQYPFFLIFNTEVAHYDSFKNILNPLQNLIASKKQDYKDKIEKMRSAARTDGFPKDIISAADTLLDLGDKILIFSKHVMNNPQKYVTTLKIHRGIGPDKRIYGADSLLDLYRTAANNITSAETAYKSGQNHNSYLNNVIKAFDAIRKIINM